MQTSIPESNSVSVFGVGSLTGSDAGAASDKPGSVSKSGKSADSSSREFNFGSEEGALASFYAATASGSSEGALASATLGT